MAKKNQKDATETPKTATEKKPETTAPEVKKARPNWILLAAVIGIAWLAMWASGKKNRTPESSAPTSAPDISKTASLTAEEYFAQALQNKGKTLGIGPGAMNYKVKGTSLIGTDTIPGMTEAMAGTDVNRVIDLLKKEGIKHVLVDPSVAVRNPMPENNVRNRLALGRPAGALSASLMSQALFYYQLGDPPPQLPENFKKALIAIARDGFGGKDFSAPASIQPIAKNPPTWTLFLTVRPIQASHLSYHTVADTNPFRAAFKTGQKAREYYTSRNSFVEKYGPVDSALENKLTLEMEVMFDEATFVGPKDSTFMWRFIEPGIYGVRMNPGGKLHYLPPWYSVAGDLRTVDALLDRTAERLAKQNKDYWRRPDVAVDRFRTIHWRETAPGGPIEDLYRFSPRMPENKDVTRENMIKALVGLGDWIADNTKPDGRYVYRYFPLKDEENDEYNMVRHCLGPFSMALTQEFSPNPKYQAMADLGMAYIEKHIRWGGAPRKSDGTIDTSLKEWMGKPLPGPDTAIIEFPEPPRNDWSSKMGAVAVSILGYTQYKRVGWDLGPEREKVLKGLANFLLYMHNPEAGDFHHYYVAPESNYYNTRNSIYPGEILYAVARLYGETKDERFRKAFKESMDANLKWFKGQLDLRLPDGTFEEEQRKNLVQFQPWIAMAMDEMYRYDQDPAYVEASNFVSTWILDDFQFDEKRSFFPDYMGGYMKVLDELPAMHSFVYTEGVAASYDLAKRAGSDPAIVEKLKKGALLTARFLIQQQARPGENDFYYPNPKKAKGAVRYCMNHNKQRIDYTYHALSSAYRIIRAASDEDYEYIQSIPMPNPW